MVQFTSSAVFFTTVLGAASLVASQSTSKSAWEVNLDKHNKDAECNNSCFFPEFTNKCNSDNPACTCTLKAERERWYCCMARKCDANVLPGKFSSLALVSCPSIHLQSINVLGI